MASLYTYKRTHPGVGYQRPTIINLFHIPQVEEWFERAAKFNDLAKQVKRMANRLNRVKNRSLLYDVYPYVWDMCGVVGLLNSYVDWLGTPSTAPRPQHLAFMPSTPTFSTQPFPHLLPRNLFLSSPHKLFFPDVSFNLFLTFNNFLFRLLLLAAPFFPP